MIGRRTLRPEAKAPSLRFRGPNLHLPLRMLAAGWLLVLVWRGLCWLAVHPRGTAVLAAATLLVLTDTLAVAGWLAVALAGALCLWWALQPGSFTRWVSRPLQLRLREHFVYRRDWQPATLTSGLTLRDSWGGDLPTLRRVREEAGRDVLRVRMLPGQTLEQWQAATARLAQTFDARQIRVRRIPNRPKELDLVVTRRGGARVRHVTERVVEPVPEPVPAARGAFPRAPRGGAA